MAGMTDYRLSVREWPESERPREKLAQYGASALSTAELLAIILRTGTAREDVVALAQRLLAQKGGLLGLAQANMTELAAEHGLGLAKGAQLKAALELGKRLLQDPRAARAQVRSPKDVADLVLRATRPPHCGRRGPPTGNRCGLDSLVEPHRGKLPRTS